MQSQCKMMVIDSIVPLPQQKTTITVALAPALNVLNSAGMMKGLEANPGLGEWVIQTYQALNDRQRHRAHILLGVGIEALASFVDDPAMTFPRLLDILQDTDAIKLRDRVLYTQTHSAFRRVLLDFPAVKAADTNRLLADKQVFRAYLEQQYDKIADDPTIYDEIHTLLNSPTALKKFVIVHLEDIWTRYTEQEWQRIAPDLIACVEAFSQFDFSQHPLADAIQFITGRDLSSVLDLNTLQNFEQIRFIPSTHNGPYITAFGTERVFNIVFGARLPAGSLPIPEKLSHSELLHRLKALADENRLHILFELAKQGEMGTQAIMEHFDLNKSAASRHLRNLHASGLILERRDEMNRAKFYRLNPIALNQISTLLTELVSLKVHQTD